MKMISYIRNYFLLFFIIGVFSFFTGCKDEDLKISEGDDNVGEVVYEGDALAFTVRLDKELSTRESSVEAYDNYIDTRKKFRVFFFNSDGDFMFEAIDRSVTAVGSDAESNSWYIRVPMNYIVDRKINVYPVDQIKSDLKSKGFKVAILANWPNEDANGEEDYEKREPYWGYVNSIYYDPEVDGNLGVKDLKNVNDLHHLKYDSYYSNNYSETARPTRLNVYSFIMDGSNRSGVNTDWVKMREEELTPTKDEDGQAKAENWIRTKWDPMNDSTKTGNNYRRYKRLWLLWDFNASCKSHDEEKWGSWVIGPADYSAYQETWGSNSFGKQWFDRNGRDLKSWLNNFNPYTEKKIDGLTFVPTIKSACYVGSDGKGNTGLVLKEAENPDGSGNGTYINPTKGPNSSGAEQRSRGYLVFSAPATGTLRIKCAGSATLVVQRSTNRDKYDVVPTSPNDYSPRDFIFTTNNIPEPFRDISITEDPEPIYIWSAGGDLIIYSIEWICSKYLYDTDREGIMPSEEHPIPMYGIQSFSAIRDWEDGATKDLSVDSEGNAQPISLIRSLAKVEVYLTEDPKHIYLRSMNRMARCEPMDVETPTNQLWGYHQEDSWTGSGQREGCEWFDIQNHGSGFNSTDPEPKDDSQLEAYKEFLSWFYGSWKSAKSVNNRHFPWNFGFELVEDIYPHLFNPDIERSDYTHFIKAGQSDGYYKYVLYVPDKNISDPNYPGITSSIAKIPDIEYRYEGMTDYLDDNNCHRIYFTDYEGRYTDKNDIITNVAADKYESEYEKNSVNLDLHWPIMRNHVYKFYVGGSGAYSQKIRAEVKDWGYEKIKVEW